MLKNRDVLSIDFGSKYIKFVVGKNRRKSVFVEKAFSVKTPDESFEDGKIYDIDKLTDVIKEALIQEQVSIKNTIVVFNSSTIISREMSLPYNNAKDFKRMIQFEIQQHFPVSMDEYITQYKIVDFFKDEEIKKAEVFIYAISKEIISDYFTLISGAGLNPIVLDIHANAISKLFSENILVNYNTYNLDNTVLLIDFGYRSINIEFINSGVKKFSRFLPIYESEDFLNKSEGIQNSDGIDELIFENLYNNWIDDIERNIKYYTSRKIGNRIDNIFIHGGSSNLPKINTSLFERLNVPVFKIERLSNVKINTKTNINLESYLNTIGGIITN